MSKRIKGYASPINGKMANLPMKIVGFEMINTPKTIAYYKLQHPTTHQVFTYQRNGIRACKRKEIQALRK
jgi:hypothetical protein